MEASAQQPYWIVSGQENNCTSKVSAGNIRLCVICVLSWGVCVYACVIVYIYIMHQAAKIDACLWLKPCEKKNNSYQTTMFLKMSPLSLLVDTPTYWSKLPELKHVEPPMAVSPSWVNMLRVSMDVPTMTEIHVLIQPHLLLGWECSSHLAVWWNLFLGSQQQLSNNWASSHHHNVQGSVFRNLRK